VDLLFWNERGFRVNVMHILSCNRKLDWAMNL
jgi:hypothetical protein